MPTPKEGNPLWMLRTFYFLPCDLMYQHFMALRPQLNSDPDAVAERFLSYMMYWLAGLFVVAEGWRELCISDAQIDKLLEEHWDSLRLFRNAIFHFQPDDRKHLQFFDVEKFNWADKLHRAWRAYFAAQDC